MDGLAAREGHGVGGVEESSEESSEGERLLFSGAYPWLDTPTLRGPG